MARTQLKLDGDLHDLVVLIKELGVRGGGDIGATRFHFRSRTGAELSFWYDTSRVTFGGPQTEARRLRELFRPHLLSVHAKRKRKPRQRPSAVVLPFKRPER